MSGLDELLSEGLIERVPADPVGAADRVAEARVHLTSVAAIAKTDPDGAYALLWDSARKVISAHMLAAGYRARSDRPGAHRAVALYAQSELAEAAAEVAHLDRIRRTRNRSEYGPRTLTSDEVRVDLVHVTAVVGAIERTLR